MIRQAEPRDVPRIRELHAEIEKKMGRKMDLPAIDDLAVLGFWVQERNGIVVRFFYLERGVEFCTGGEDAEGIEELRQFERCLIALLVKSRARVLHCHVPQQFPNTGRHLEHSGFERTGYEHFILGLMEKP